MKTVKFLTSFLYALLLCTGAAFACYCSIDFFEQCQTDCSKWMDSFQSGIAQPHHTRFPN